MGRQTRQEPPEALEARQALSGALLALVESGQQPPCATDPQAWTSEDAEVRTQAAEQCTGCPLLAECAAVGQHETWHVWAGVDRTRRAQATPRHPSREIA